MQSIIVTNTEIDDIDLAAQTLAAGVKERLALRAHSIGIVFCDADADVGRLGGLLHEALGMDIVGLTTTAMLERHTGYTDMGITLCVLTADDARFAVGCTGELEAGAFAAPIRDSYGKARECLGEDPRLVMALAPYVADISSENYVEILDEVSGGAPVFGGVATDHYDLRYQKTFFNGRDFSRCLIFVLFGGAVRPIFAMEHHFGAKVEKKGVITQAEGTRVLKVGDVSFKDFVAAIVPVPDEEQVIFHFQSTPFVMELPDFEKGEQPVVRALLSVDHATGAGGFLSRMPEGSTIYLNVLQRENLRESSFAALRGVIRQMAEAADYEYSMLFVSTCNARHLLMGDVKNMESDIMREALRDLPSTVNAMGYYGFGEICPTGTRADGRAKNRFHNISFAVCAL